MTPKINYKLIADAVAFYETQGFEYVEVPWLVRETAIRATLPVGFDFLQVGYEVDFGGDLGPAGEGLLSPYFSSGSSLVGSAEQGFITMDLPAGRYVGVTPCFRCEDKQDLFYRYTFMKVELFDNRSEATVDSTLGPALEFHNRLTSDAAKPNVLATNEGFDIMIGGIEVGSYGVREHPDFGRWVCGTGLALPRFSVANAIAKVL